jgi:hypothetical protein
MLKYSEKILVEPRPLDTINEIENIDFLKLLDVQGSELDCRVKSGREKLKPIAIFILQAEVSFVTLYNDQPWIRRSFDVVSSWQKALYRIALLRLSVGP